MRASGRLFRRDCHLRAAFSFRPDELARIAPGELATIDGRFTAASLAMVAGIAAIVARLIIGSILDRFNFGLMPFILLALPALAYGLLLMSGGSLPIVTLVALLIGVGSGASLYLIIYLTTQYGGLRHFGKIYGTISIMTGTAAGIGPITAGWIFDTTGSYETYLIVGMPIFVLAGLLIMELGPYPQFEPEPAAANR